MARTPSIRWHDGGKCWTSEVGPVSEKTGRRKPIYFRAIPYGPNGSANHRRAQDALRSYIVARDRAELAELADLIGRHPDADDAKIVRLYRARTDRTVGPADLRRARALFDVAPART